VPNEEDTLAHPEQPRFLLGPWLWAVCLFVFFGAIVAIAFAAMSRGSSYEEDKARTRLEKLKAAREEWAKAENSYGWVDQNKGVVRIPIERAMTLAMQDLQRKEVTAAGPIATPAAETPQAGATGAAQPPNPQVTAPSTGSPTPAPISVEGPKSEIRGQPAAAANPPNAAPGTQPGRNATPAARPNSQSQIPAVTPTNTPIQHAAGTPIPAAGATISPSPSPH
jgi:hypothetical protein